MEMAGIEGIHFDPTHGGLICSVYGTGVRPKTNAVRRHLRGDGYFCKGAVLKEAVNALT
jgi:hypothetical protein